MPLQRPKWALATLFLVDGTGFGLWAAHVPVFKQNLQLTNGALSEVLLCLVGGAILSMPAAGHFISRFTSRDVIRIVAVLYVATLASLASATTFPRLLLFAAFYGAAKGALDVSVNAQAIALEHHFGRSSMSLLQGCWSVGGLIGAGASSLLLGHSKSLRFNLLLGSVLLAWAVAAVLPLLVNDRPKHPEAKPKFIFPDSYLLRLALIAFFGLFAEGAIGDWAAVYLHSHLGATLSVAAAGYATYAVAMATGRFLGDWLTERFSFKAILRGSGLLIATGFGCTLLSPILSLGIFGLVLTGVGVANIIPVIMTLAGRDTRMGAGPAISALSTIGYFGFLAGPPLIGSLAVFVGLEKSLGLVVLSGAIVALGPAILITRQHNEVETPV